MPKEKLTLSVDKEVVQKAKSLGLNISDLTELALKGFTVSDKEADRDSLYRSYENLFAAIKPLLEEYGAWVQIASEELYDNNTGEYMDTQNISLCPDGAFSDDLFENRFSEIRKIPVHILHPPQRILTNLVEALAKSIQGRKERLRELEMAKRIVDAIATTLQSRSQPRRKRRAKRLNPWRQRVT